MEPPRSPEENIQEHVVQLLCKKQDTKGSHRQVSKRERERETLPLTDVFHLDCFFVVLSLQIWSLLCHSNSSTRKGIQENGNRRCVSLKVPFCCSRVGAETPAGGLVQHKVILVSDKIISLIFQ